MKVLIADDHWMIRASLKHALKTIDASFRPLEAASYPEALDILRANPDTGLMLIDLVMPGSSEFDGLRSLRKSYPDIPVAVISVHENKEHVLQSIADGVIGYIPKSTDGAELLKALSRVLNGDVYFPREILHGAPARAVPTRTSADAGLATVTGSLTAREEDVLALVSEGFANSEIAKKLDMSPSTVRVHMRNIGRKLNLKTRSEFVGYGAAYAGRRQTQ